MATRELDAIVWCSDCRKELGRVYRVPAQNHGVYMHVSEPEEIPKVCPDCSKITERMPFNIVGKIITGKKFTT